MKPRPVYIRFLDNDIGIQVSIGSLLYDELNIEHNSPISLQFGHRKIESIPVKSKIAENIIYLDPKIIEAIKIPFEKRILVKFENNTLHFGPLIGIFTTNHINGYENHQIVMEREKDFDFYKKILLLQQDQFNYTFMFNPNHVNWLENTVAGFFFRKK